MRMEIEKTRVGILCGGMSAEHEVSIESAKAIYSSMDRKRFEPVLIYISPDGRWRRIDGRTLLDAPPYRGSESLAGADLQSHSFIPWENGASDPLACDIYFPVLHGPNGEDGRIQGMFELAGIPYVGADSFSSALAMNKAASKMMFQRAGLETPRFVYFREGEHLHIAQEIRKSLRLPVFVKPNSLGSSVGISKVRSREELARGLSEATRYDTKILVERAVNARELEVAVLATSSPRHRCPVRSFPRRSSTITQRST